MRGEETSLGDAYIVKAACFMIRSSSTCDDHGEDNHTEKYDNFDAREPKLEFSEEGNAEVIYGDDCY